MSKKLTIDEIVKYVEENSKCKLLSDKYKNNRTNLIFKCKCGNKFETTYSNFKKGQRQCKICGIKIRTEKKKEDFKNVQTIFLNKGFKLMDNSYVNARAKMLAVDNEGYKILISLDNLKRGKIPQKFYQNNPYTIDNIKLWLKQNNCNFKILSNKFISSDSKLIFECFKGHKFETTWNKVESQNAGCPICNQSKGENAISAFLKNNKITFKQQFVFENCKYKKKLRFDFYIPVLNICIEYQGVQHYKPIKYFGGIRRYNVQVRKDNIKVNFCKQNNIKLVRIPYFKENEINDILENALL